MALGVGGGDQILLCCGGLGTVLCAVRCLAASLASIQLMPVAPHLSCDNQKHPKKLPSANKVS